MRATGTHHGCRNIMLYRDDVPNVEVGVQLDPPCPLAERVVASTPSAGTTATTVHHGWTIRPGGHQAGHGGSGARVNQRRPRRDRQARPGASGTGQCWNGVRYEAASGLSNSCLTYFMPPGTVASACAM
ncbi:hypothetical protein GTS_53400 [Gandjariella thermophila]|uniref:Uncharacterized protein n=1 Tax=Gandjariella thermophila TaxID=1931992 RepID=A0A4D4JII8_9PSEU|nr:hypothetical protein GTS_53400 [Gandjariella thermophila]